MGGAMQYAPQGTASINGRTFQVFTGGTVFPAAGTAMEWDAFVRAAGNNTYVLSVGTGGARLGAVRPALHQVAVTFRVRA
jgi:hypothetical protein